MCYVFLAFAADMFRSIGFSVLVIVFLHGIHWLSVFLYSRYCVTPGWNGYMYSFLAASSPACKILMEIQYHSIRVYDVMLIGISVFLTNQMERFAAAAVPKTNDERQQQPPVIIPE